MYFCTYSCLVPRLRRSGKAPPPPAAARKTRITIRLDDDVLAWFRRHARASGGGYQSLINLALRDHIGREGLATTLRRIIREELARAARVIPPRRPTDPTSRQSNGWPTQATRGKSTAPRRSPAAVAAVAAAKIEHGRNRPDLSLSFRRA